MLDEHCCEGAHLAADGRGLSICRPVARRLFNRRLRQGASGLGDFAIRFGYQRFSTPVLMPVIVVLVVLVGLIQAAGVRSNAICPCVVQHAQALALKAA